MVRPSRTRGFLRSGSALLTLDAIARRYGKLPTELMDLDWQEFNVCLQVHNAGVEAENEERKK